MAVWNFPELCQASAASEVCSISGVPWGRGGGAVFGRSGGALEQKNGNGMSAAPLAGNGGQVHCLHQLWAIVTNAPNGPFGCMVSRNSATARLGVGLDCCFSVTGVDLQVHQMKVFICSHCIVF